jgi:hypothetical protein
VISSVVLCLGIGFQNCSETKFTDVPTAEKIENDTEANGLNLNIDQTQPNQNPGDGQQVVTETGEELTQGNNRAPQQGEGEDEDMGENGEEGSEMPDFTNPGPGPIDPGMIIANCAMARDNGALTVSQEVITFEDTKAETGRNEVCEWGPSQAVANDQGNYGRKGSYQQARYEQDRSIQLPQGAVLCDLTMTMDKTKLRYDDMFYMSLNGQVIASNANYVIKGGTTNVNGRTTIHPGLVTSAIVNGDQDLIPTYVYDWSRIRGGYFGDQWLGTFDSDYCLGEEQGLAECQWPKTDTSGDFKFIYEPQILMALGSLSDNSVHTFKFAVTGDDDRSSDCYHEEFSFALEVQYYIPSGELASSISQ